MRILQATTAMSAPTASPTKASGSDSAELRLINEFDGSGAQSVTEWLEKVELVCSLRGVTRLETVIPLRLSGGAFKVYQQIPSGDRGDATKIMDALKAAFGDDPFAAYDLFISRKLQPAESVDVYLADLRRLATAFGGVSDKALGCAFVSGLPEIVRQSLRASSRMEKMTVNEILQRARAILADEPVAVGAVRARGGAKSLTQRTSMTGGAAGCFECGLPNHRARDCLVRQSRSGGGSARVPAATGGGTRSAKNVKCFLCGESGHIVRFCPGNGEGEKKHAPAFSPNQ